MKAFIHKHQLLQIVSYIQRNYQAFGTVKKDGKASFDVLKKGSDLLIPTPKTIIPFKKILWPNNNIIDEDKTAKSKNEGKIALVGLTNCDAIALKKLFLEFWGTSLLSKRDDLLIISTTCESNKSCFCTAFKDSRNINYFDLHIQTEKNGYSIFANTKIGMKILKDNGIKFNLKRPAIRKIKLEDNFLFNNKALSEAIADKENMIDTWHGIANNCFGCGSCSVVCPLCFCTHQTFENQVDGKCLRCLKWDSCFSKSFSEIHGHLDFRPNNVDRLYNWYHHKFVRAFQNKKHFLCTGCGRCIENCPAHLNQYRIARTIEKKEEKTNE